MAKICILTTDHSPFDDRIFYKQARSFVRAGYEVVILPYRGFGFKNETVDSNRLLEIARREKIAIRDFKKTNLLGPLNLLKYLWCALREKPSFYHCHESWSFYLGVLLKFFSSSRIIYDVHEFFPEIPFERHKFLFKIFKFADRNLAKIADGIICADTEKANRYKSYTKRVPIEVIGHYSPLDIFCYKKQKVGKVVTGIYSGGISIDRGLEEMLYIVYRLKQMDKNFRLILNGSFVSNEVKQRYEQLVKEYEIEEKVEYTGWILHEDVPKIMSRADIGFCLRHPLERYIKAPPIKIFEYMASSLPVVASNFPFKKELVEGNGVGICVDPLNRAEILKVVLKFVSNPQFCLKTGKKGRRVVEKMYNWKVYEKKLLSFYKQSVR